MAASQQVALLPEGGRRALVNADSAGGPSRGDGELTAGAGHDANLFPAGGAFTCAVASAAGPALRGQRSGRAAAVFEGVLRRDAEHSRAGAVDRVLSLVRPRAGCQRSRYRGAGVFIRLSTRLNEVSRR